LKLNEQADEEARKKSELGAKAALEKKRLEEDARKKAELEAKSKQAAEDAKKLKKELEKPVEVPVETPQQELPAEKVPTPDTKQEVDQDKPATLKKQPSKTKLEGT
jgi:hypothetical protein